MKKFIFPLLSLILLWVSGTRAQNFEFETTHTEYTPGFFMVRIFPLEGNQTISLNPVFVKNFNQEDRNLYNELTLFIQETGGTLIEERDVKFYISDSTNKIIFLGEPKKGYINLKIKNEETALNEFQIFKKDYLDNIVLQNIDIDFGGNIYDVLPSKIPDISQNPITIIGKFKKNMKTRITVKGEIAEGIIESSEALDIQDITLSQNQIAPQIPELWEKLWKKEHPTAIGKKNGINWFEWNNYFPVLLFILGILCFVVAIKSMRKSFNHSFNSEEYDVPKEQSHRIQVEEIKKIHPSIPKHTLSEKDVLRKITRTPSPISSKAPLRSASPFVDMTQILASSKTENKKAPEQFPSSKAPH